MRVDWRGIRDFAGELYNAACEVVWTPIAKRIMPVSLEEAMDLPGLWAIMTESAA